MRYNKQGSRKTARLQITKIKSILSGFEIVAPAVIIQRIHKALVDIVKHLARADCNAGHGILRNLAGNLRVFGNEFIHAVKQRAAAREANAVFRNVACKLRRSFFKKVSNRFKDILKRFFKRIDHFV